MFVLVFDVSLKFIQIILIKKKNSNEIASN